MDKYEIVPIPTHMNAPDAWAVLRRFVTTNEDGEQEIGVESVCWGLCLKDSLAQIELQEEERRKWQDDQ